MSVRPWLERAGRFTIEPLPCPHFLQPVDASAPAAGVLHTTEGGWDGSLAVFKRHYAPHFLVGAGRIAQLAPVGLIGAALVTHNWLALVQVEVVGFSKQTPWMFDDPTAEAVASLMAACKAEYGIPLTRPWPDGVYGMARANDPHRNGGQFGHVAGWFGHGDVPAPDSHWDPGDLEWSKLFSAAAAIDPQPSPAPDAPPRPCPAIPDLSTDAGIAAALASLGYRGLTLAGAVRLFQSAHGGLAVDGICGPLTEAAILQALGALRALT